MLLGGIMNFESSTYDIGDVCHFSKAKENWGEFGNMSGGFSFRLTEDTLIPSTENLYQAMRFTEYPDIQREIIPQKSGFAAKLISKKYRKTHTRADFEEHKLDIMRWCLQLKLANHKTFGDALLLTGDKAIVEKSHKDAWWGTLLRGDTLMGINILGQLLMELRDQYRQELAAGTTGYKTVTPPNIPDFNYFGVVAPVIRK
jgi:ribA/ribD-fused uncharacterized protein